MGLDLDESELGQTPMNIEQLIGLKIPMIHTHAQINAYEQANINEALRWLMQYTFGLARFSWGAHSTGEVRKIYMLAIQQAEAGDYEPLIYFAQH